LAVDTFIDGGTMEIASGGSIGNVLPVSFTESGGALILDFSQGFLPTWTIAGFASPQGITEFIDLKDIVSGASTKLTFNEAGNNTSGTLTVTDGTHTANLTLLGLYSQSNFTLSSDGAGGTKVTDPAVTASATITAHA
jgi:hypothetical protein